MTMNLVFDSVAPGAPRRDVTRLAVPRTAIARAMRAIEPHVDEAHRPRSSTPPGRLDDLLFALATAVLLIAVLLPSSGLGLHAAALGV
jgi:hypothetical protein